MIGELLYILPPGHEFWEKSWVKMIILLVKENAHLAGKKESRGIKLSWHLSLI